MGERRSVHDFLPMPEVKKELKDETNVGNGTDTSLGGTGENLPQQSGGSNTGGSQESIGTGTGADGKQTDTNNDVGGLGNAKADAPAQNPADGAGSNSSKPSNKKGTKPTGK